MYYTNKKIGQLIKEYGLNQKEFADLIETTPAVVSKWVNGKKNPSMESLKKICEKMDVPFSYFQESHREQDRLMNCFNDLAMLQAVNNFVAVFGYSFIQEGEDYDYYLIDENMETIRTFSQGELSCVLYELTQTVNEKLFYAHRKNYLKIDDLKPRKKG